MFLFRHIGLLEVNFSNYHMNIIPLQTVRPFIFDEIVLSNQNIDTKDTESINELLVNKVFFLIFFF